MKEFLLFILLGSSLLAAVQGFGLITNKGDPLELLDIKTKVFVKGPYAEIQHFCTYKNSFKDSVKAQFFFPQAEDTVLSKFEIKLRNQIIAAQVVDKEKAKANYLINAHESTISEDFKLNKVEKNILDIKIGEILPNETIQIEFSMIQPLDIIINKFYGLKLPAVLKHKEWTVEAEIVSESPFTFTDNPSHQIKPHLSDYMTARKTKVYKAFWNAKIDTKRDFIIYFRHEKMQDPRIILAAHPTYEDDYMLFFDFVPELNKVDLKKAEAALSNDNLLKVKTLALEDDIQNAQGEFLFVIDRSNSMRGARIENLKKALVKFLLVLPKNAFFNIISFGTTFSLYKPQSVKNNLEALEEATNWIYTLEADMGETEILGAFEHIISQNYKQNDDLRTVFLFTDGAVFNANEVVWFARRWQDKLRFCTIGIGSSASRYLLNGIAEAGHCQSVFVDDGEDIGDKAVFLVKSAISQYINNISWNIMCFTADDEELYHSSHGTHLIRRLLKDQPFRKWVHLPNMKNIHSCHAILSYDSSLKGEKLAEEFDISDFRFAEKTERWHKLAVGSRTYVAEDLRAKYQYSGRDNPAIKYQVLSQNTHSCLLGLTQENYLDTEVSTKGIYLTDLSPADYGDYELTIFNRFYLYVDRYIQAYNDLEDGVYNYFKDLCKRGVPLFFYYFKKFRDLDMVLSDICMYVQRPKFYVPVLLIVYLMYRRGHFKWLRRWKNRLLSWNIMERAAVNPPKKEVQKEETKSQM